MSSETICHSGTAIWISPTIRTASERLYEIDLAATPVVWHSYVASRWGMRDPDFGEVAKIETLINRVFGKFIAVKPLTIVTYWNVGGYTTTIMDFDRVFGYGDSIAESQKSALDDLVQLRLRFGALDQDSATLDALLLRDKLVSFLQPFHA